MLLQGDHNAEGKNHVLLAIGLTPTKGDSTESDGVTELINNITPPQPSATGPPSPALTVMLDLSQGISHTCSYCPIKPGKYISHTYSYFPAKPKK